MGKIAAAAFGAIQHRLGHVATTHVAAGGGSSSASTTLSERIGEHSYWCIGNSHCTPKTNSFLGPEFNVDTIVMTWIVMALIVLLALYVRSRLDERRPRGAQNVLEFAFEFVTNLVSDSLGIERTASIGPLAVALFMFILLSNYIGLIPVPVRWWHSATSDLNTTLGLALMVFILVQVMSVRARGGGGYFKHFAQPFPALAPLTIIEELSKPLTLSFRLFGNIFAGEVLILVFGTLLSGSFLIAVLPLVYAVLGIGLGLFVGGVQAFIFTILTVSYIGIAISTEGH